MQGTGHIVLVSVFALLLRWSVTYHSYSGEGKPPMFGDYEAQRHWQEITFNLPIDKWYINTTDNDLQYWGLDYPPLTAYHSFALGYIADKINSSYVKLHESRGFSSEDHKYFMRLTVLFVDAFVYLPSMIYFVSTNQGNVDSEDALFGFQRKHINLLIMLIYPGLILIDHGHFQYNSFSLGLFISAVTAMLQDSIIVGSVLFVTALNYKQMELYHALPIFFYILGKYLPVRKRFSLFNLVMLLCVSLAVVSTFCVIWLPFIRDLETFASVVFRLFPVARGVFEDKVANVWCTINVVYKLRDSFSKEQLAKVCLAATTFAALPSCLNLYLNPQKKRFVVSLISCSLAFFLFSYQVHEKSILLVAAPVLLHFQNDPFPCFWFLIISHFSMLPLYIKDDLYLAYWATFIFYFFFVLWFYPDVFDTSSSNTNLMKRARDANYIYQKQMKTKLKNNKSFLVKLKRELYCYKNYFLPSNYDLFLWTTILFYCSILGVVILSIIGRFLKPPAKYPDLFPLLISVYSCGHFIAFYLYFNYKQFVYKL